MVERDDLAGDREPRQEPPRPARILRGDHVDLLQRFPRAIGHVPKVPDRRSDDEQASTHTTMVSRSDRREPIHAIPLGVGAA